MTIRRFNKAKHGATCILYAALVFLIGLFATIIMLLVWPYDEVQIKGDAQIQGAHTVALGATLHLKWDSFCIAGQDLYYERWADLYDVDGDGGQPPSDEVVYSYGIPPFVSYHDVTQCESPAMGSLTLPNYLPPGTYRIRFVITYHPNFIRTETVTTQTEEFTILASPGNSDCAFVRCP